jgi:hypothetical protein
MKRTIIQLGIVLGSMVSIAPSVHAGSIRSGTYGSCYPCGYGFTVRGNKFFEFNEDDGIGKMQPLSTLNLQSVKQGVFYNPSNKSYWCFVNKAIEKSVKRHPFRCSRNGWQRI